MLTREQLLKIYNCNATSFDECANCQEKGVCSEADIVNSHLSALDEIDRLTAARDNWKHEAFATKDMLVAANDEIDRLTAELAAKDKEVQHYMGVASIIAKEQGLIGNFPTGQIKPIGRNIFDSAKVVQSEVRTEIKVDRTKPLVQDTGNLLIPKREEGTAKEQESLCNTIEASENLRKSVGFPISGR